MQPYDYTLRDFTVGDNVPVEAIRSDLKTVGLSVVRIYDDDRCGRFEQDMNELALMLRADGGTAHGGRGMGGITKRYGAACHPGAANIRLDPRARAVHAAIYGAKPEDVMSGWDAVAIVGTDKPRPRKAHRHDDDPRQAYYALTGGTLQPHVDVGLGTHGAQMEAKMATLHPEFAACVQSQLVCHTVPKGGSTFVFAPGQYYDSAPDPALFETSKGRDFCVCTDAGYKHFHGKWRCVEAPIGCLILWLSRTPHGNKLADPGVDPGRRCVYISWQVRTLVDDATRATLKRKKLDAVYTGGSTDHWATSVPKVHRGSHYSNGKGLTNVIYDHEQPPRYDEELTRRIDDAF